MNNFSNKEERKKEFLKYYEKNNAIIRRACKEMGITRETVYRWQREDENYKNLLSEIEESQIDYVEDKLFEKIDQGSEKSIHFYLKYKGRKKGYSNQLDIKSEGIIFNFISDEKNEDE